MPPWEKYSGTQEVGPWAKYGDEAAPAPPLESSAPQPTLGQVAGSAIGRGGMNLLNTPMAMADLVGHALIPPGLREKVPHLPNYPMKAAESLGLVDPAKQPQTPTQRVVDTAVQAGTQAGMVTGPAGAVIGAVSGGLAQITKELTGNDLLSIAVGVLTPFAFATRTPINLTETGKDTLKEARKAGYVVQPSAVKPSIVNSKVESVAGKAAVAQDASIRNQEVTNTLAAKAIGVPEGTPLTMQTLEDVRRQAAKPYEQIEALRSSPNMPWFPRFHSGNLLEQLKQARADATAYFKAHDRVPDPALLKQAKEASSLAESLERDIENVAVAAGKPELVEQLKASRQLIARTYDVERALNLGDGNVSASIIGRMLDKGAPLTGELKVIGKFAQAFPRVSRDASMIPPPSASGTDAFSTALMGGIGYSAGGPAGAAIGAGLPLMRTPARNYALSKGLQARLLREPYQELGQAAVRGAMVGKTLLDYREEATK